MKLLNFGRGEWGWGREHEVTGWSRWRKDREEEQGKRYSDEGAIIEFVRNMALGKFTEIPKDDPN